MSGPTENSFVFGPVPSRRLGRSLGVNTVPAKTCSYGCVYCQLGRTARMTITPRPWYDFDSVLEAVARKQSQVRNLGETIDYVTLVADGEPTLDANLAVEAEILRSVGMRTAILTNASLIDRSEVSRALRHFDWVSLKLDAVDEGLWRKINRPHGRLKLKEILDGMTRFSRSYKGILCTETMLVEHMNDEEPVLLDLAAFLQSLNPRKAFLTIPLRPPAEPWVRAPSESAVARAYAIFQQHLREVECLTVSEGDHFSLTGDPEADLLAITAVHPMRYSAVAAVIEQAGASWDRVEALQRRGQLVAVTYGDETFYVRRHSESSGQHDLAAIGE